MEKNIVGKPINFRGLGYSPINGQEVVYLFGLVAEGVNIRVIRCLNAIESAVYRESFFLGMN